MDELIGPDKRHPTGSRLSGGPALPIRWSRALVALTALAVAATLAFAPGLAAPASAADSGRASGSLSAVSAQCASARSALSSAQQGQAKAKKKAVKRAKRAHHKGKVTKAKVTKAKKRLKKAKRQLKAANASVASRAATASRACVVVYPPGAPVTVGKELGLLHVLLGGDLLQVLEPQQLRSMLEAVFPGVAGLLDPDELLGLLEGFNSGGLPTLDQLSGMLGDVFDRTQLEVLLAGATGGAIDHGMSEALAGTILNQLSHLAGGAALPAGGFDPASLTTLVSALTGSLSPGQLGGLIALLADVLDVGGTWDADTMAALLEALVPGLAGAFDAGQLAEMASAANGAVPGADQLVNLLGGFFPLAQLQEVVLGTAGQGLADQVVSAVVGQLGAAAGGSLPIPEALSPTVLADLVGTVESVLSFVLGGGSGGGGGLVCGVLPILCP